MGVAEGSGVRAGQVNGLVFGKQGVGVDVVTLTLAQGVAGARARDRVTLVAVGCRAKQEVGSVRRVRCCPGRRRRAAAVRMGRLVDHVAEENSRVLVSLDGNVAGIGKRRGDDKVAAAHHVRGVPDAEWLHARGRRGRIGHRLGVGVTEVIGDGAHRGIVASIPGRNGNDDQIAAGNGARQRHGLARHRVASVAQGTLNEVGAIHPGRRRRGRRSHHRRRKGWRQRRGRRRRRGGCAGARHGDGSRGGGRRRGRRIVVADDLRGHRLIGIQGQRSVERNGD